MTPNLDGIRVALAEGRHVFRAAMLDLLDGVGAQAPHRTHAQALVEVARAEWRAHVEEPRGGEGAGRFRIDDYIREGLGWPDRNLRDKGVTRYTRNGDFAWCGAFVAFCGLRVGLDGGARHRTLPSTYRLQRDWSRTTRRVHVENVRPGDILVVRNVGSARTWGDHITLVEDVDTMAGLAFTIEGNARGLLPDGSVGEGVIRRTRPLQAGRSGGRCPVSGLPQSAHGWHAYRLHDADFSDAPAFDDDAVVLPWPWGGPDSALGLREAI